MNSMTAVVFRPTLVLLLSVLLAACASAPVAPPPRLFHDALFKPPSERIGGEDVFAVSDAMRAFLHAEVNTGFQGSGFQQGFIEALYNKGQLKLEYESTVTRNAAQAFDARAGNCLSLVIMTGALAKELGLPVRYQRVYVDDTWGRSGDVYFSIGHVNLSIGKRQIDGGFGRFEADLATIDFLPPRELRGVRTQSIEQDTIVAMFMNNRAAETLAEGRIDDAYWWARAAVEKDPRFFGSYNTLGIIYRHHGNLKEAEQALTFALEREPDNVHVLSNLATVLDHQGRVAESKEFLRKLAQLEPNPPYKFFNEGLAALRNGDYKAARDLFTKETDRAPYNHEFRFWLAIAYVGLGNAEQARKELNAALETSTTRKDRAVYAAKLDRLNSLIGK
jgi:tetratricopeptide (TPR) repeat protein